MRNYKLLLAAVLVLAGLVPLAYGNNFIYHIGILIGIQAILALSMHLMLRINQLSLAQAGFMGMGAYASALITRDLEFPFIVGLLSAVLIPAFIAYVLGGVILRIRGVHFALLTFVLGEAIVLIFVEFVFPFGGNSGVMNIPPATIASLSFQSRPMFYLLVMLVLGVALLVIWSLLRGNVGAILSGLEHNEPLVQSLGIVAPNWRRCIFMVSAAIAGASGSLYAHYLGYISPEAFNILTTVNALVINVVGGISVVAGPLLGAILLVPLPELFRSALRYQMLLYGVSLLLLMMFLPKGIGGLLRRHKS